MARALCKVTVLICMLIGALASQEPAAPSNLNDDPVVALEGGPDEAGSVGGAPPAQILEQHGEALLAAEQQQQQLLSDGGSGVHDQAAGSSSGEGGAPHSGRAPAEEVPAEQLAPAQPEPTPQQQQVEQQPEEDPTSAGEPASAGAGEVPSAAAGGAAAAEEAAPHAPSPPEQPQVAAEPPAAEPPVSVPTPPAPEQEPPAPAPEPPAPAPEPETIPEEELRNFALTKDGAKVVAANKEAKKLSALLDGDSDTYVKNDCKAEKWFIIELSQVAKISRVELAQYELYSSRVKSFEVRGRQTHPRVDGVEISKGLNSTQWRLLGALTAENKKGSQRFALERPMWARYLLLQLQSHYGSEPVCAINGFAAYGKSAAEEFEDHLASQESLQYLHSTLDHELGAAVPAPPAQEPAVPAAVPAAAQPAASAAAGSGTPGARQGIVEPGGQADPAAAEQVAAAAAVAGGTPPPPGTVAAPCGAAAEVPEAAAAPAPAAAPGSAGTDPSGSCGSEAGQECIAAAAPATGTIAAASEQVGSAGEAGGEAAGSGAAGEAAAAEAGSAAPGPVAAAGQDLGSAPSGSVGTQGLQQGDAGIASPAVGSSCGTAPAPATEQEAPAAVPPDSQQQQQQQQPQAGGGSAQQAPAPAAPAAEQKTAQQPPPAQQQGGAAAGGSAEAIPSVLTWSPKAKGSVSIYDIMLQEIKTTKVQQKLMSRSIADLQRNATALYGELAADIVSVAAQLAKVQKESNQTEDLVLSKVEAMVDARMRRLSQEIAALQVATSASAKREVAVLCLLGLLGAAVALGMPAGGKGSGWVKWVVAALAVSNGAVAVLLQCRAASGWGPVAVLQALPSE